MDVYRVLNPQTLTLTDGTFDGGFQGFQGFHDRNSPAKNIIPPEYREDFDLYIPSDDEGPITYPCNTHSNHFKPMSSSEDHGSSTRADNAERSSTYRSTASDNGEDSEDDDYQPGHAEVRVPNRENDTENMSNYIGIARRTRNSRGALRGLDKDDEQDDPDEMDEDTGEDQDDGKPAKARVSARVKKLASKSVGVVRYDDAHELQWFDPTDKVWRPAVYHQDIRCDLIEDATRLGSYRHKFARGKNELDVTAFHPAYADNGPDRQNWPKILFQYQPTMRDFLHTKPGIWQLHDGRVVVDCNNDAMNDFAEIPVTLATNVDSWLLTTCMRLNNHITIQDFRGRMMGDRKLHMADPLGRNRISMNMTRFRKFGCCLTWNSIRNVDTQREYLDEKLPRRCIRLNSTESFRKLHSWEVAEAELRDAGKFLKRTRATLKDVSSKRSQQVYKRKRTEFEQLRRNFDRINPDEPDDYDTEDEEYREQLRAGNTSPSSPVTLVGVDGSQIKAEPTAEDALVKPGRKPRRKAMQQSRSVKRPRVLPNDPVSTEQAHDLRPICPRRHKDHGGFLTRAPNKMKEAQLLYDLLGPSRIHYERNTSEAAPETFVDECYKCQWADIQDSLNEWHEAHEVYRTLAPAKIIGLQYVEHGELYWNADWNEAWFGPQPKVHPKSLF